MSLSVGESDSLIAFINLSVNALSYKGAGMLLNFFYRTFVRRSDFSSLNFEVSTNLDARCCAAGIVAKSPKCAGYVRGRTCSG
jgi:hypothetical protein